MYTHSARRHLDMVFTRLPVKNDVPEISAHIQRSLMRRTLGSHLSNDDNDNTNYDNNSKSIDSDSNLHIRTLVFLCSARF